jgi:hypothetical protein
MWIDGKWFHTARVNLGKSMLARDRGVPTPLFAFRRPTGVPYGYWAPKYPASLQTCSTRQGLAVLKMADGGRLPELHQMKNLLGVVPKDPRRVRINYN